MKFILGVRGDVGFQGEKVLSFDVHIHLWSDDHSLVASGTELLHGLPHAESVAALHGQDSTLPL